MGVPQGVLQALPNLIIALLIFVLACSVIRAFRPVFDRVEQGQGAVGWLADLGWLVPSGATDGVPGAVPLPSAAFAPPQHLPGGPVPPR